MARAVMAGAVSYLFFEESTFVNLNLWYGTGLCLIHEEKKVSLVELSILLEEGCAERKKNRTVGPRFSETETDISIAT